LLREWQTWHLFRNLGFIRGTIFSVAPEGNARPSIYTRNQINALPLLELCSRGVMTVRMTYTCRAGWEELIIASAYLP
jgi:hypothetical protein